MDTNKEKKSRDKILGAMKTSPIVNADKELEDSKVFIPSESDVEEAKDWVDQNEL